MKLAYITISHKPISATSTGGLETFSIYLLNALVKRGVSVTLYAGAETDMSVFPGVSFRPVFSLSDLGKSESENLESKTFTLNYALLQMMGLHQALNDANQYDMIHYNCAQWYAPFVCGESRAKIVTTIHVNNLKPEMVRYTLQKSQNPFIANISNTSAKLVDSYTKRRTIYNGIDISQFRFNENPDSYVAWLGRIAPVKGLKEAVLAAKAAGVKLVASGPIDFPDYFEQEVKPYLDSDRTVIGPLSHDEKVEFFRKAKAVLQPVSWDEPFGLVSIEAMACGTPVIAFARGGLTETVKEGVSGYLVTPGNIDEMAQKIKQIDSISRVEVRKHVEDHFSAEKMASGYAEYYQDIIEGKI